VDLSVEESDRRLAEVNETAVTKSEDLLKQ